MIRKPRSSNIIPADVLLGAYASGFFPMGEPGENNVQWYYSDPAAIIPLDKYKIPRTLSQFIKKCNWRITTDSAFKDVITRCAKRENTWISDLIIRSYVELHRNGFAHSVEVWDKEKLIGGLYGVTLGSAFCGESMFHRKTNASKVALSALLNIISKANFTLLDIQMMTPVMEQFGAVSIPRGQYLPLLQKAIDIPRTFPQIEIYPANKIFS